MRRCASYVGWRHVYINVGDDGEQKSSGNVAATYRATAEALCFFGRALRHRGMRTSGLGLSESHSGIWNGVGLSTAHAMAALPGRRRGVVSCSNGGPCYHYFHQSRGAKMFGRRRRWLGSAQVGFVVSGSGTTTLFGGRKARLRTPLEVFGGSGSWRTRAPCCSSKAGTERGAGAATLQKGGISDVLLAAHPQVRAMVCTVVGVALCRRAQAGWRTALVGRRSGCQSHARLRATTPVIHGTAGDIPTGRRGRRCATCCGVAESLVAGAVGEGT